MRHVLLIFVFLLSGCATLDKMTTPGESKSPELSARTLAAGECGLYVWTADAAKTFTLFASETEMTLFKTGAEIALTEKNPSTPPAVARQFMDENGKAYNLTLLSSQDIDRGIRYKAGRLTTIDGEGWEVVTPIVGLYACQPAR